MHGDNQHKIRYHQEVNFEFIIKLLPFLSTKSMHMVVLPDIRPMSLDIVNAATHTFFPVASLSSMTFFFETVVYDVEPTIHFWYPENNAST